MGDVSALVAARRALSGNGALDEIRPEHAGWSLVGNNDRTAEAEFHLKSNFIYDLTMREGRVTLARAP